MPQDFDDWRDMGNVGWGWDDVRPYFERSERASTRRAMASGTTARSTSRT
jgi:choline dehydrogenase